jgi:hypothetical protein
LVPSAGRLSDDALDECLRRCRPAEEGLDPATSRRIFEEALSRSGVLRRCRARFAWAGTAVVVVLLGGYAASRTHVPAQREGFAAPVLAVAPAVIATVEPPGPVREGAVVREKRERREARVRRIPRHRPRRPLRLAQTVPAPTPLPRAEVPAVAAAEQPRRELLVVVARAAPELELSVRSAPEETPWCDSVEAVQQSATGEMFRVQYTVSTEREGSDTIITPVGQFSGKADPSGKAEWERGGMGEWGKLSH